MITFYVVSIYEYSSNLSQTLAAECRRRFLTFLTNMRTLLCRPVSERIWNRGGPSCETLVFIPDCGRGPAESRPCREIRILRLRTV
jgi:hypothetical protein